MSTISQDCSRVILENRIKLVKEKIEYVADRHEFYMHISPGSGSMATEILEKKQERLFELLDKLQKSLNALQ